MSIFSVPPPVPRKPIDLARLATIFAVVFGVAFGLCTVSAASDDRIGFLVPISLITEAICLAGLLIVGGVALVRSMRR